MTDCAPQNDVIVNNTEESYASAAKSPVRAGKKKEKSGAFGLFKAAMFMMRKRPKEKAAENSIPHQDSNANWTKLVGSMRPLHMQESLPSPPSSVASDCTPTTRPSVAEIYEDTIVPASPAASSSASMSQYASAMSLRDLVDSSDDEEEEDPDELFDAVRGDEMIDAKADEFIAKFYRQIQLQNTNSRARRH